MLRFISSLLMFLAFAATACISTDELCAQQPQTPENAIKVFIPNMHCESCAKKIRSRIFTVKGVSRVVTWVKHDLAVIESVPGQNVSAKAIWDTLEKGEFKVDRIETPQGVIKEKPQA